LAPVIAGRAAARHDDRLEGQRQMAPARLFAITGLPLLAMLLAAQAPVLPPKKPAALAQQQRTAAAAQPKKPAPAAVPAPKPAPAAARTAARKPETNKPEPKPRDFSDYFRIWGVSGDTTRAEIVARFGEPARVGNWDSKPFYYFNDTLTFFFSGDDTVSTMIVGNSFAAIPPKTIPPEVIAKAFIGKKRDDVLKAFGPPDAVSSDNYRYWPKAGVYKVEFQCYDFKGYVCGQMLVQF
jgi:hypothetical protein